jgi:hypothetical protein
MTKRTTREIGDPGYSGILDQMDIPRQRLSAYSKPVDLSSWPQDNVLCGGLIRKVSGSDAGLPLPSLRGAKAIPFLGSQEIDVRKCRSALFIVGIDFVPKELENLLALKNLTLHDDGSLLDQNNEPAVGFVTSEMYRVQLQSPKILERGVKPEAAPFPFTCFSFTPAAFYHETGFGGNHRWYDASTLAVAYGPDSGGGCSGGSPHTRIDYLQAIAAVRGPGNFQQAWGTDQLSAYDVWDVGYGWPAHGVPLTTHSAIWADGTFSMSRTANLSW